MTLRVIDLFCGPGGFSTGFEAAGFKIVAALDFNKDAIRTYDANHHSDALLQDLKDFDYSKLPEADIVIGGPPCTQFSSAKSNKTRNVIDGLLLVQSFLRCVYLVKPKYWVMENVPTIQKYLPRDIPLRSIGIDEDGNFEIPTKVELVAADYGVPQKRRRYFIGNFPIPEPTHCEDNRKSIFAPKNLKNWRTMGDVLACLPEPADTKIVGDTEDPNFDFSIPSAELSDHFYDTRFNEVERRSIFLAKTQHPYMGRLAWPDHLDRPARTVVATQLGRETLILTTKEGEARRATIRECATLQSFPITYQFFGKSFGSKYRQAGDAVPPKLSFAIANSILAERGQPVESPTVRTKVREPANVIPIEKLRRKRKVNFKRKANFLFPSKEVRGTRCELFVSGFSKDKSVILDNEFERPIWHTELVLGEGLKLTKRFGIGNDLALELRRTLLTDSRIKVGVDDALKNWAEIMAQFDNGDLVYACHVTGKIEGSPFRLQELSKKIADKNLNADEYHNVHVDCSHLFSHQKANRIKVRVLLGCLMAREAVSSWQI